MSERPMQLCTHMATALTLTPERQAEDLHPFLELRDQQR